MKADVASTTRDASFRWQADANSMCFGPATGANRGRPRPRQRLPVTGVFWEATATHLPLRFWNTSVHE